MSYIFVRDVTFKSMADAMKGMPVAAQIVKLYKEAVGVEIQMQRPLSGCPVRLRYVAQLDSLDKWQADTAKMAQNPAFHKLLGELAPLVEGTRTQDELWAAM
jgi:hypothetical protein